MLTILIISLIALGVVLLLVGRYLLNDLSRLWLKHSKSVFRGHSYASYYSELGVVLAVTLALAVGAAALKGAATVVLSLCTTDDLTSFAVALRGTFSFTNEAQLPGKHLIMFFAEPLLKLLAIVALMQAVNCFFKSFNKRFKGENFTESDNFFFTSIAIVFLIFFELLYHAQNVKICNATANLAYLMLDKLTYLICFLSVYWIKTLKNNHDQLLKSMDLYLVMGDFEKKVALSPIRLLVLTYVVGLVDSLPYFLGFQWIKNNITLLMIFVIALGFFYTLLYLVFCKSWNFIGTIVFDVNRDESLARSMVILRIKNVKRASYLRMALPVMVGMSVLLFGIFYFRMLFMFLVIAFWAFVGLVCAVVLTYDLILLVGLLVKHFRKRNQKDVSFKEVVSYQTNVLFSASNAMKVMFGAAMVAFMLIIIFPKDLNTDSICLNGSVVDVHGNVLYMDDNVDGYSVPVSFDEIPFFFRKCLVAQEDRYFFEQNSLMPNKSNWNGVSFAFLKNRGGSNLNAQLVKNLTYVNASYPQDISRKMADMLGGVMLNEKLSPECIMENYCNIASFHGARGFRGVNSAALFAFGRPLTQLNELEQLYLVNTLPRTYIKVGKQKLAYTNVHLDSMNIVKEMLVQKAEAWKDAGLISKKEFNTLRHCTLDFTNKPYRCDIAIPTRLRLEKEMEGKGSHLSYITLENEKAMNRAFTSFQDKPVYRKNGSELQVASLVVDVHTGHVIGHFSSGQVDYTDYFNGFSIGSLGKPMIICQLLSMGASPNLTLYDGKIGKRKTPKNANHDWSNKYVGISKILSSSLNAPFANIWDIMNPKSVYLGVEQSYARLGIPSEEQLCEDTYNYPYGNRLMTVQQVADIYQMIMNDGVHIPLRVMETGDNPRAERIYDADDVAVVKQALSQTVVNGTMRAFRKELPQETTFYSKTGTSSQNDGWNVLSDGDILIVTWASYARHDGNRMMHGTQPLYGSSTAGAFNVLVYNELKNTAP